MARQNHHTVAPFAIRYSPRPYYALFAHRHAVLLTEANAQDSRVVPEPDTVGKAHFSFTFPILAKQDCTCADLPFQGLATRNPMLLFSFEGLSLFRFDAAKLLVLLFQLPPRMPRKDELITPGYPSLRLADGSHSTTEFRTAKDYTLGVGCMSNPRFLTPRHLRRRATSPANVTFQSSVWHGPTAPSSGGCSSPRPMSPSLPTHGRPT